MSEQRAMTLLNEELDGELDAGSRAELSALLAGDPALRSQREELNQLDVALRAVADVEIPPADLARRIAARIELPHRASPIERLISWWRAPSAWVPAGAFAMGLAVAVLVYPALQGSIEGTDSSRMTGTLMSEPTRAGLMPHARLALALDAVQGQVTLADRQAGSALLEFDLKSTGPVDILIDLGDSGLSYDAAGTSGVQLIASEPGKVQIRSAGERYFALPLQGQGAAAGSVKVEFSRDGHTLSSGVLAAR